MKVLLDSCITGDAKAQLEAAGHDVVWAGEWDSDPGDDAILQAAHREARVLVTLDKDFGELAVLRGESHSGILRLVNFRFAEQATVCREILATHSADLQASAILLQNQAESEFGSDWSEASLKEREMPVKTACEAYDPA